MNIFFLDADLKLCAKYHCDKHVVKMITEHNQMLTTNLYVLCNVIDEKKRVDEKKMKKVFRDFPRVNERGKIEPYKMTHLNHPWTFWLRQDVERAMWAINLTKELCEEYTRRYKKIHKGSAINDWLRKKYESFNARDSTVDEKTMPQCMPEQFKVTGNPVAAYRKYYKIAKSNFAKWNHSEKPKWMMI